MKNSIVLLALNVIPTLVFLTKLLIHLILLLRNVNVPQLLLLHGLGGISL
jgi:hypothetical protein